MGRLGRASARLVGGAAVVGFESLNEISVGDSGDAELDFLVELLHELRFRAHQMKRYRPITENDKFTPAGLNRDLA